MISLKQAVEDMAGGRIEVGGREVGMEEIGEDDDRLYTGRAA